MNQQRIKLFQSIQNLAEELGLKCYLVGGYLRDQLHGMVSQDLDFSLSTGLLDFLPKLAEDLDSELIIYPEFLTASIKLNAKFQKLLEITNLDFCQFRQENYLRSGQMPKISSGDLITDLARRDFTINSLAIELSEYLEIFSKNLPLKDLRRLIIDQHAGITDLDHKSIRVLHDKSFLDDPTRIFRAVRYKIILNGDYHTKTKALLMIALQQNVLQSIASYRISNELLIMSKSSLANQMFIELIQLGVFDNLFGTLGTTQRDLIEKLQQLPVELDSEDTLTNLLIIVVGAYHAEAKLKSLGLKNKIAKKILTQINHV